MTTTPLHDCFTAHRGLVEEAERLAGRLRLDAPGPSDLLRLAACCVGIASQRALAAREEREAILSWAECDLADRQIRSATYQALRDGAIGSRDYDRALKVAIWATRARQDEMLRLRRRLRRLAVI